MVATLAHPVCVAPGAREPFAAPSPEVCGDCEGLSPDLDFEPAVCLTCNGTGFEPTGFRLSPTRSHKYRAAWFDPAKRLLTVKTASEPWHKATGQSYSVQVQACDWQGRSFLVAKHGSDRLHEVYIGADAVTCSCEGHTYLTSAKHNQKAWDEGEEVFPTHGCVHTDALAALVASGWFDDVIPPE